MLFSLMDSECFIADLIDGIMNFILKYLHSADVYLISDRYYNYSIKSNTRTARVNSFARGHNLVHQSPLPSKDTLSCTKSKVQLIQQISAGLVDIGLTEKNRLVITSNDHCPTELKDGKKILRSDLGTSHEEADNIVIQQINQMGQHDCSINAICEDTDVFILLCHFCNSEEWNAKVFMNGLTKDSSTTISINKTVKKHKSIVPSILAAHALTGCDSVSKLYGIGKAKAISALKSVSLSVFGNPESSEAE